MYRCSILSLFHSFGSWDAICLLSRRNGHKHKSHWPQSSWKKTPPGAYPFLPLQTIFIMFLQISTMLPFLYFVISVTLPPFLTIIITNFIILSICEVSKKANTNKYRKPSFFKVPIWKHFNYQFS